MIGLFLCAALFPVETRAAAPVEWTGPVPVGAVTGSVKWTVRAVPDGAAGAVCVWEENRGRKVCCRDTRDLYAQRLDATGRRLWAGQDVPVAVLDPGEEILALAASPGGGALVLFRRGNGSLFAQELGGDGAPRLARDGRQLDAVDGVGEWLPGNGSAVSTDGRSLAVVYALPVEAGAAVRVVTASGSATGWSVSAPVELDRAMGLHPGTIAWCRDRWLVATWSETTAGVRVTGRWLAADGTISRPFDLGSAAGCTWAYLQAVGDGGGGAWLLRSAVDARAYARTHRVTVISVTRAARDRVTLRHAPGGEARTAAMFIPSVMIGAADQPPAAATPATVSWRATSWIVPTGGDSAVLLRNDGARLVAATVRRTAGKPMVGTPVAVIDAPADAFTPAAWVPPDGGVRVVWGRTTTSGITLETAWLDRALHAGPVDLVADARSPRIGVPVTGPDGRVVLVYAEALGPEAGAIRAVPLPGRSP